MRFFCFLCDSSRTPRHLLVRAWPKRTRLLSTLSRIFFFEKNPPAVGFPARITETRTRKNLLQQWWLVRTGTETGNTYGPGRPARPPEAKIRCCKKKLTCRSASESVFPGILDQIFRGFIDSKKRVFSRRSVEDLTNLRSGSQIFVNVCVMYVMMYVVCAGKPDR